MDERHVAARAAHVESNDVVDADPLARAHGSDDAAGGTGKYGAEGFSAEPLNVETPPLDCMM